MAVSASNPQDIPELLLQWRGSFGRFRVTPRRRAILIPAGEGGRVIYAGLLVEPFQFTSGSARGDAPAETELLVRSRLAGIALPARFPMAKPSHEARASNGSGPGQEAETWPGVSKKQKQKLGRRFGNSNY